MDYENFKEALVEGLKEKKNVTKKSHVVIDEKQKKGCHKDYLFYNPSHCDMY